MIGCDNEAIDPKKMTNKQMHTHFTKLLVGDAPHVGTRIGDIDTKLVNTMEKIDGLEACFNSKLDTVLARLPTPAPTTPPAPCPQGYMGQARRVPLEGQHASD
jgi:hypothetical protein